MPLTLTDLRHYAAHSECKRLETWQEQAAYIRRHSGATFRLLGEFFGVSHMAIQRLLKAFEDGRKPGVNGRPTSLTTEEEDAVLEMRQAAQMKGETPCPADLIRFVSFETHPMSILPIQPLLTRPW